MSLCHRLYEEINFKSGIDDSAVIERSTTVGENCYLGANVYTRVLANPESIRKTLSSSIIKTNFAILNPFINSDGKIERALIRKWNIDGVLCRQSGGRTEKLWKRVCLSMGIDLWLLERPSMHQHIDTVDSYENLISRLKSISI